MSKPENLDSGFKVVLIGIVLITLLFLSYNYFYKTKPVDGVVKGSETSIIDKIKTALSKPKTEAQPGVVDDQAAQDSREEVVAGAETQRAGVWVATNYKKGDVKSGTYQVKRGDTLWEIAEAVYGDGSQWHKILDANKDKIGFLPNGSQALIVTGQTLVLP